MTEAGFVLVASPFTGPFAWSLVADVLRSRGRQVALHHFGRPMDPPAGPIVLVGHSGAGSHLPAIARELGGVERAVYVDALLPHPGRSWAQTVPKEFVARLESQATDGNLPPWPQWWGEKVLRQLISDDELRARFVRECPAVPVEVIYEVMPEVPEPPAVFVQLSAMYESETAAAHERGWPTVVLDLHHLAILTHPEAVTDALLEAARI